MRKLRPFHLAIPVDDLQKGIDFYEEVLGCKRGRSDEHWCDFDFYGHQLVLHVSAGAPENINPVDGKGVPIPHFGVVLEWQQFDELANSLRQASIKFDIEPYLRFEGKPGEQKTMFFRDPSGNALEFKAFKNEDELFKQQ